MKRILLAVVVVLAALVVAMMVRVAQLPAPAAPSAAAAAVQIDAALAAERLGAALMRTTISPTMLSAGIKDNVLPPEASAVVNFRIRPGETQESVIAYVIGTIDDTLLVVAPTDSARTDPSPVSDASSPAFQLIASTIRAMLPGERVPVLPYLVMGGTDAKYWNEHSDGVFRFLAVPLRDGDVARVHGVNERIRVEDYATAVGFFSGLLRGLGALKE